MTRLRRFFAVALVGTFSFAAAAALAEPRETKPEILKNKEGRFVVNQMGTKEFKEGLLLLDIRQRKKEEDFHCTNLHLYLTQPFQGSRQELITPESPATVRACRVSEIEFHGNWRQQLLDRLRLRELKVKRIGIQWIDCQIDFDSAYRNPPMPWDVLLFSPEVGFQQIEEKRRDRQSFDFPPEVSSDTPPAVEALSKLGCNVEVNVIPNLAQGS